MTPEQSGRIMRLLTAGVVAYSVMIPGMGLWTYLTLGTGPKVLAVAATLGYVSLHVRVVRYAARGERAPYAWFTLAAMAVLIAGLLPALGHVWLWSFYALAASVLIVVPLPWSLVIFGALLAALPLLAITMGDPDRAYFYVVAVGLRAVPLFVLVWLLAAVRQLIDSRLALAADAIVRERMRIEEELQHTVGGALEEIRAAGERVGGQIGPDPAAADAGLDVVTERSRLALAEARKLIRGYQPGPLRAELDMTRTLLSAAGIETRLVPAIEEGCFEDLPPETEGTLRTALRSEVTRLLRDDTVRRAVITIHRSDGQVGLDVRAEGAGS